MPRNKKQPETDNSRKPWVSNYPPLKEWLDKHDATCMWQVPSNPDPGYDIDWAPVSYIECWLVNGRPVIVVVRADKMGWDIFTDCNSARVDETLADAEKRVGLK